MNKANNYYPSRNLILKKNYITRFFFGILINRTQFTKDGELNSSSSPAPPPYPSPAPGSFFLNDRYVFVSCNRLVLYWFRFLFCFFLCVSSWNRGSISPPFHRINPWYSTNHVHDRTCTFLLIRPPSPLSHVTQHIIISVTLKKKRRLALSNKKMCFFGPVWILHSFTNPPPSRCVDTVLLVFHPFTVRYRWMWNLDIQSLTTFFFPPFCRRPGATQ